MDQPFGRRIGYRSLAWYLEQFNLPAKLGSGDKVAELWENDVKNGTTHVSTYCAHDAKVMGLLAKRMSGFFEL
jgi:hypothetical protein